jgi:succinylarginine dihydrolase
VIREINFDGIVGPSHNYAGLSLGNLASARNAGHVSQPRAAALQGIDKMRSNIRLGLVQGIFVPQPRPGRAWLAELGTTISEAEHHIAANAMSASSMWAANAATVSPSPDTIDGKCHLTVANLKTMPHRSHEWPATLAQLRLAFAGDGFAVHGRSRRRMAMKARPPYAAGAFSWRTGRRGVRLWRNGRPLPGPPEYRGIESHRPPAPA